MDPWIVSHVCQMMFAPYDIGGHAQEEYVEDLTHQEIAQHLRVYRESVAARGELRKARIIAVNRKRIRILNRLRLERAARE